jgi:prevent-host-death family protein
MGRVVSATEARIHFGELMRQAVESQEPIIVERGWR